MTSLEFAWTREEDIAAALADGWTFDTPDSVQHHDVHGGALLKRECCSFEAAVDAFVLQAIAEFKSWRRLRELGDAA
jgi:hypothetical protein